MDTKVVSVGDAITMVRSDDTICTSGFVGIGTPDQLLVELERRFLETGEPRGLTLLFAAGQGDGRERGLNRLGHSGLLKRVIGGHWGLIPKIGQLALSGQIEAYNLPQGCISHLYRDIAAGKPGTLSRVGLGTFVDPRLDGGKLNDVTTEEIVDLMMIGGEEYLFYRAHPIDVALIRGTTADTSGNITMEREALTLDNLAMAMAARNSHGIVIAQVERIAKHGSLRPREVVVPGIMVDCVVVAEPEYHQQTYATAYSPAFSHEIAVPLDRLTPMPLDARKVIARRCAFELPPNGVINLGIGMPEGVARVAAEEGLLDMITLTTEPGVIGGMPAVGLDFGAAVNTEVLLHQNQQFDFYDGGGLDLACLGMAEVDSVGNVNVSRFQSKLAGAGGFINISQNARRLVFAGSFAADGQLVDVVDGRLVIRSEGQQRKFHRTVQHVTFSGPRAVAREQPVLYITERCVFSLTADGLQLIEIAPGIDLDRDVLAKMDFAPVVNNVGMMDARLFASSPIGLRALLHDLRLSDRISYDPSRNLLFLNFENMHVRTSGDVQAIQSTVEERCKSVGRRVDAVVNYELFRIDDHVARDYVEMVAYLEEHCYGTVSRYSASAFQRRKLGDLLVRSVAPHIFETRADAQAFIQSVS